MRLEFGANTDSDTWDNVFAHMIDYVIEVNGVDMVLHTTFDGYEVGLFGYAFDDEREDGLTFDPDQPIGFEWDEIESVLIY